MTLKDAALAAYEIAAEECGAPDDYRDRQGFVEYVTKYDGYPKEWRFVGSLGFGGKLRYNQDLGFYVDMYRKDETPERKAAVRFANNRLAKLIVEEEE